MPQDMCYQRTTVRELRKLKLESKEDVGQALDVAVNVDAAWQKRYGFINSLNDTSFVISINSGCVLDYVVKTKYCQECKSNHHYSFCPSSSMKLKKRKSVVCSYIVSSLLSNGVCRVFENFWKIFSFYFLIVFDFFVETRCYISII